MSELLHDEPLPVAEKNAQHWFSASLPNHPGQSVWVALPSGRNAGALPANAALDAAAALAHVEPWLCQLEDWLGCGLMFDLDEHVPSATGEGEGEGDSIDAVAARALSLTHLQLTHTTQSAQLYVPLALLRTVAAPPAVMASAWVWPTVPCELLLGSVALSESDFLHIEPGALLLFPTSFTATWTARLHPINAHRHGCTARVYEQRGQLCVAAQGDALADLRRDLATVRLRQPVAVRPADLWGWTAANPPALTAPQLLAHAALALHGSRKHHDERLLAVGQLMPVGSGFGLRISQVARDPSVSAGSPPSAGSL